MKYFIAVDWGSSNFRAYLISEDGIIEDSIKSNDGIFTLKDHSPIDYLATTCGIWLKRFPKIKVLVSGMAGSTKGLTEAPYLTTPLHQNQIGSSLTKLQHNSALISQPLSDALQQQISIVPGVCYQQNNEWQDVMRGEEVQVLGASHIHNIENGIVCLPGTHSKWVVIEEKCITKITTFITGELFEALQSLKLFEEFMLSKTFQRSAFVQGVESNLHGDGILNSIFSVRVKALAGEINHTELYSFLSGIAIGAEIIAIKRKYQQLSQCLIIANQRLQEHYSIAFSLLGITPQTTDPDRCYTAGSLQVARQNHFFTTI